MTIDSELFFKLQEAKFQTGGSGKTPIPEPEKKPGVQTPKSRFSDGDSREALNVAKMTRKRVVALSPFMMEDPANGRKMVRYGNRCAQDSLNRGEAPIMSHLFYYSSLSYNNPIERDIGLHAQLTWIPEAQLVVVYMDMGVTPAMQVGINVAEVNNRKIEYRSIGGVA